MRSVRMWPLRRLPAFTPMYVPKCGVLALRAASVRRQRRWMSTGHSSASDMATQQPREGTRLFVSMDREQRVEPRTGLRLDSQTEYPAAVQELVASIYSAEDTAGSQEFAEADPIAAVLSANPTQEACNSVLRFFALDDQIPNAFKTLHLMHKLGVGRNRETYRLLMYATCRYYETDLGLYVLENMIHDRVVDWVSFKRLFDTLAADVDKRAWVLYDVMAITLPLSRVTGALLRTTCYLTEFMKMIGMPESQRKTRKWLTLPNPLGEPVDQYAGLFERGSFVEVGPDGHPLLRDEEEEQRLARIVHDFQDIHRGPYLAAKRRHRMGLVGGPGQSYELPGLSADFLADIVAGRPTVVDLIDAPKPDPADEGHTQRTIVDADASKQQ